MSPQSRLIAEYLAARLATVDLDEYAALCEQNGMSNASDIAGRPQSTALAGRGEVVVVPPSEGGDAGSIPAAQTNSSQRLLRLRSSY